MGSINPRTAAVPKNSVLMVPNTSINVPVGYTQETSLNCKYIKGIPTACTNPGSATGSATHTHGSAGGHTHTTSSTAHTHTASTCISSWDNVAYFGGAAGLAKNHTHIVTSTSSSPTGSAACGGGHTHDAVTNEMAHRTVSFYKKTETSISFRRKTLPTNTLMFYAGTTVPCGFAQETNYHGKHIKGIATCPGSNAGTNCHTHSCVAHTHSMTVAAHTHTGAGSTAASTNNAVGPTGPTTRPSCAHTHVATGITYASQCGSVTSSSDGCHSHGATNMESGYRTLNVLQNNTIKLRRQSIEKNMILTWVCPVACIPIGFGVSDGTNCTVNMLCRYPKGSCTPNTTGGCASHTHTSDGPGHTHTGTPIHIHTASGSTGTYSGGSNTTIETSANFVVAATSHTHTSASTGNTGPALTATCTAYAHTHDSQNHEPVGVTVAFIQRI